MVSWLVGKLRFACVSTQPLLWPVLFSFFVPFFIVVSFFLFFSFCSALLLCRRFVVSAVGSAAARLLVCGSSASCLFLVVLLCRLKSGFLDRSVVGGCKFFTINPPSSQLLERSSS